jgi:mono/diheme cytochrome c family protein
MPGPVPAEHERGERLYNSYCLSCHGRNGRGDGLGPPIVDSLFLPAITPDDRFFTAVRQGVNQRDYNYGAMPPLNRVSDPEIQAIVGYVRWLQARAWDSTGKGN